MVLATCAATAGMLAAQSSPARDEEPRLVHDRELHAGVRLGVPYKAAVYVGGTAGERVVGGSGHGLMTGRSITALVGLNGAQVGFGRGTTTHVGYGRLQLAILRTWGDPLIANGDKTYLGAEALMAAGVGFALGAFLRVQGPTRGNRAFVGASLVVGL